MCCVSVSKTIEELSLEWKTMNPVIMGKGLRMPQFEIVKIAASDCQESFQIGECHPQKSCTYFSITNGVILCVAARCLAVCPLLLYSRVSLSVTVMSQTFNCETR